jgi:peptidoglycan/LPS O-acetylase OafA/YrhL
VTASLILVVIGVLVLGFLGMKYPMGRKDWPFDGPRTFRLITTGIMFFLILGLIYWITQYWDYPVSGKALVYIAFICFPILMVLGFIFPEGKRGLLE